MSQAALNTRDREPAGSGQRRSGAGLRRSNGIRLFGMIFLLIVLGSIVVSGWMVVSWMKDASRMPLSKLVVTGERHFTKNDDIRQAILSLGAPGTFMTQNVDVIQQQIERLPWIKQVSVRKQWPNELKIHLVEYVPVARWNDLRLVDAEGKPFSVPAERTIQQKMPLLYGPEGSENDVLEGYRSMSQELAKSNFRLKMVSMSARHSWQLGLEDDIRLELGRDDPSGRLARFEELYPALQQQAQATNQRISYVDLRYDTGAAVGWAPAPIDPQTQQHANQQQNQAQVKQQ